MLCALSRRRSSRKRRSLPDGPLRILVAYPPGGVSDSIARALAERAARQLRNAGDRGEPRLAPAALVAMESLKRAPPDGRTLVFSAISPLTIAPELGPTGFRSGHGRNAGDQRDGDARARRWNLRACGATRWRRRSRRRKRIPGQVRWATSGVGTTGHRVLERVRAASGVDITHIPYKGGGPQLADALAGRVRGAVVERRRAAVPVRARRTPQGTGSRRAGTSRRASRRADAGRSRVSRGESGFDIRTVRARAYAAACRVARLNRAFDAALRDPEIQRRLLATRQRPDRRCRGGLRGADCARTRSFGQPGPRVCTAGPLSLP